MLGKKKKLTKKEIKEDKLVKFVYQAENFFEKYKSKVLTYGIAVVAIAAAVYFYLNQNAVDNDKASTELSRVMTLYDQGAYLEAIEGRQGTNIIGLKKIVDEYGSTENGEAAKIYLANCYSFLGKQEDALGYYEDYGGNIDYFKAAALAGRAGYYESKGDYEKAANLYSEASTLSEINAQNADYLLKSGICYIKTGDIEEAKIMFDKIKEDYPTSLANREADKYKSQVD
jgi:tetratricopeptide (TPR) repeat protein